MYPILTIDEKCISCGNCKIVCPENCIVSNGTEFSISDWACTFCHICIQVCPVDCIKTITPDL